MLASIFVIFLTSTVGITDPVLLAQLFRGKPLYDKAVLVIKCFAASHPLHLLGPRPPSRLRFPRRLNRLVAASVEGLPVRGARDADWLPPRSLRRHHRHRARQPRPWRSGRTRVRACRRRIGEAIEGAAEDGIGGGGGG
ncbi:unnamed protein product [Linum trigynum]|uniref:Uncharacterized protein n=1 Tax=Linum trigynum TaxID=586398 RepID=A0AAV2ENI6_9ROSI